MNEYFIKYKLRLIININFIFIIFIINLQENSFAQDSVKFAVIGDYGNAGPDELAVANLVSGFSPDFIVTTGDNNYDVGSAFTIDANIGQYYHNYIYPYTGAYGAGAAFNKFFPSLGNHDWGTPGALPYLNYFVLPGNERYYDFVKGPVHFFVIDSDSNETDGRDSNSVQAIWLKNSLKQSSSRFNIVYFHHPPYCSGLFQGSEFVMRWPFKAWGANAVMSGHEHLYERLTVGGLTYFVNGLGGNLRSIFGIPISGSQLRYSSNYGAMIVNAYNDSVRFKFYNIVNSLRDNYKITTNAKILSLTSFIQGFYNSVSNSMNADTVKVVLRNSVFPYTVIDSAKNILNLNGAGIFNFNIANNATGYYIVLKHRNSIETWSSIPDKFIVNNLNYNFSQSSSQTFGNNVTQVDTSPVRFAIYSGDVNQDGIIDAADISSIENDAANSLSGYIPTDVTGDDFVDASDISIVEKNSLNSIYVISP